jgi:hypothetical protein
MVQYKTLNPRCCGAALRFEGLNKPRSYQVVLERDHARS